MEDNSVKEATVAEELMFEELEQRISPAGGCATSSSCNCTSSSCVYYSN